MNKFAVFAALSLTAAASAVACGDDETVVKPTGPTTTSTGTGAQGGGGTNPGGAGGTGGTLPNVPALNATQIDRMGRAAINTALTTPAPKVDHEADADAYNQDDNPSGWAGAYVPGFAAYAAVFDGLDETCGNQLVYGGLPEAGGGGTGGSCEQNIGGGGFGGAGVDNVDCYGTIGTLFASDWIVVHDNGQECGYLGAEVDVLSGTDASCGGRTPIDDVIASSYTVLTGQFGVSIVDDGILVNADVATAYDGGFPYLPDPT